MVSQAAWTDVDYDKAGEEVLKELGIDAATPCEDDCLNPLYQHGTRGVLYVGDQRAAKDDLILDRLNIVSVVNCTHNMRNWYPGKYRYYKFPLGKWRQESGGGEDGVKKFLDPMLAFLEDSLESGGSILLHCLAGAHRAGIAGVMALMFFRQISGEEVR